MKTWLLLFTIIGISGQGLAAAPTPEELAHRIELSKKKVEEEELSRRKILSALYEINRKLRRTVSEKSKLRVERIGVEENVRRIGEKLTTLEETSAQMKAQLAERLKTLHRLGGASFARILFSAGSSSQLDRNLKILGAISARDRDAIKDYQRTLKEISSRKTRLAQRAEQLKTLEEQLREKERRFLAEQNLKSRLLNGVRKKHLFALQDLKKLKEQTRQAGFEDEGLLDTLLKPSFSEQKGKLPPPVSKGMISRGFGVEKAVENSWTVVHKGMRWSAPRGTQVRTVYDGTVVWVGSISTSGQSVIVDHGDHYYTVYSELENPMVQEGQEVRANETLALVGRSGLEEEPGLHFEIRHFSEPDDPQAWMKGTQL
ncbi:MAG TPA: peptidoglycan DD-metalloendopeptidase family protein [Pseudobdellovibrionaceae bacterium]|nr:peptidoglycan DD-metalloendopeptidase family protein [Pseudobdellovibrionaceae bacterium]